MDKTIEKEHKTKNTKIGEIPEDWNLEKLRKNTIVLFSNVDKHLHKNEIPVSLCNYQDVYYQDYITSNIPFSAGSVKPSEFHKFQLHKGDVIITKDSEDRKDIAVPAYVIEEIANLVCGYHLAILRPNEAHLDGIFLSFLLQSHNVNHYFQKLANGVTRFGLTTDSIKNALIPVPPLPEQQKIAEILSSWDLAISIINQLLYESLRIRMGLEQQLLSGKKRFPEFLNSNISTKTPVGELPEDWELKHILDITQRAKKPFTPEPETLYREIGIRSHSKGIFHKDEVTGASLGNKSVFWIQPDCFVVNIVFAWEHAIAKTTEAEVGMIASHRFPMYRPKKGVLDLDYLLYYFKTARGKHLLGLASPGGAGRNKTLGQGEFAKLKIPVPSLAEQKRIVAVLSEADREIELLKQQIATLKEQKKGLMQKLLTGEIRVNTDKVI